MNGAAILALYSQLPEDMMLGKSSAHAAACTAMKQIHYMAGDNDKGSYIAGFGENASARNHHRNSVCAPWEQKEFGGDCEPCAPSAVHLCAAAVA